MTVYATRIKMKLGCGSSNNVLEIDSIYITGKGNEKFCKKEAVHDAVKNNPGSIKVNKSPNYPALIHATSSTGEKYVRSEPNDTENDNLLKLPRE